MKRTSILLAQALALVAAIAAGSLAGGRAEPAPARAAAPAAPAAAATAAPAASGGGPLYDDDGFRTAEAGASPQELAGAEIWYKATAGNARFHTYVFQQRLGVLIDWYRVLGGPGREERFATWGLINDPGCCTPGAAGCPAKSYEETYGFDWCPGDEELLKYVGRTGYRDPACDFKDPAGRGDRQDPCDLAFGTSTGALGLRKFPNPRFDAARWQRLNGGRLGTWEGFNRRLAGGGPDAQASHLLDPSIEPPFLIGESCGACHIAFNPLHPPADREHPKFENLTGAIGNQYTRVSEIMASGMPVNSLEWQLFSHERPGTVDTSAIPNDQVHNPGTMNAILNVPQRPLFNGEKIVKWRRTASCAKDAKVDVCWCEPGKPGKCWERGLKDDEPIHHILKGGEDSVGTKEAVQRVYFNIGSCSEECWVNHLADLRQLDPTLRNFGQTPFDIGQCRRDCPNFRAIEDRLEDIVAFLSSRKPTDLYAARGLASRADLEEQLDREHGAGAVARGRVVFAQNCARCHSSQAPAADGSFAAVDFFKEGPDGRRVDWMGNDQPTPVAEVGTYRCRALHSNHMKGHIWEEYGSETYRDRLPDGNLPEFAGKPALEKPDGRGYYRNISLLSAWAHAPFLHNNSVGPELCGDPAQLDPRKNLYRSPYVDAQTGKRLPNAPPCWAYDPSVEGRYRLYEASMDELLNPGKRIPKVSLLDDDIKVEMGPRVIAGRKVKNLKIMIPAGTPAGLLVSFQHKPFVGDLVRAKTRPAELRKDFVARFGKARGDRYADLMQRLARDIVLEALDDPYRVAVADAGPLLELYSTCNVTVENDGHRFGESLSPQDKKALTAFLATL